MELVAAYRGDSAASAHLRQRLDALGLSYNFTRLRARADSQPPQPIMVDYDDRL